MKTIEQKIEQIKESVEWFSKKMKAALRRHLYRPGWENEKVKYLWNRLNEEVDELDIALHYDPDKLGLSKKPNIIKECADVANLAMMIADIHSYRNNP